MHTVVITCGPGHEPIDAVRRITNFATGEIGAVLSRAFEGAGWRVVCLHGQGSRWQGANPVEFTTNADLLEKLSTLEEREKVRAVFHAAALCDFGVAAVETEAGGRASEGKLSSRGGDLILRLKPLPKVLPRLAGLFPSAAVVGWKYEVDGDREGALAAARRQLAEAHGAACVVNGPAFGEGFGLLEPGGEPVPFADKEALAAGLVEWLGRRSGVA